MRPTLLDPETINRYLSDGYWTRATMVGRYEIYARERSGGLACQDNHKRYTWGQLHETTDRLAANLIALGLSRDSRALVQMPTSSREIVLRIALKKAGIIGAYVPVQWRRKELSYVLDRIEPDLVVLASDEMEANEVDWLDDQYANGVGFGHLIDLASNSRDNWVAWGDLTARQPCAASLEQILSRRFAYNEVSLITVSSGTSGLAKLCEWPEAAQVCVGRGIAERLAVTAEDNIGMFAPMSGAAGALVWAISGILPCSFTFPRTYRPDDLLSLVGRAGVTVATTVPVILARLAQEPLEDYDLALLRVLRVGTAAANMEAAIAFENGSGCKVVVASGSMECPGFGHAHVDEPKETRLDGSTGLPLPGCRLWIVGDHDGELPIGEAGELQVSAPFASSGYWRDEEATNAVWSDGRYATGDIGALDENGRLTLLGRLNEVINRSGYKILPIELEQEIARHPDVFDCAVIAVPDEEYGEVPWAFIQPHMNKRIDPDKVSDFLGARGMASYKIPVRIIELVKLPRISGSKLDKKELLKLTLDE